MPSIVQYFSSLPPRICEACGNIMEEMADCYPQTCPACDQSFVFYAIVPAEKPLAVHVKNRTPQ